MRAIDWQALFFDREASWPGRLMARAERRYGRSPDAEAAYNYALDAISADDWSRLRSGFSGTGSPEGFLAITFLNLLEEYAVRKYGRRRPPAWLQRLNGYWTRIYELLCLRRQAPETIVDLLCADRAHPPADVRRAIAEVRGRISDCGQSLGEQTTEAAPEPQSEAGAATPLAALEQGELSHLLQVLAGLFDDGDADGASRYRLATDVSNSARTRLQALAGDLELTSEERLLLRLLYQERCTIPEAARDLRLHERTARRTHARLMARLREILTAHGVLASHAALVE